jgi:hypothetical protein
MGYSPSVAPTQGWSVTRNMHGVQSNRGVLGPWRGFDRLGMEATYRETSHGWFSWLVIVTFQHMGVKCIDVAC